MKVETAFREWQHCARRLMTCCKCCLHGIDVPDMSVGRLISNLRTKRCFIILLIFFSVSFLFLVFKIGNKSCSRKQGQKILEDLCLQYKSKKITGNLCQELCDLKTLKYRSCIAAGANKNVILTMRDGAFVVFKSRLREPSNRYPLTAWEFNDQNVARTVAPDVGIFEEMIYSEVSALFNTRIPQSKAQLLSALTDMEYDTEKFTPTLPFMNTVMNLVQQEEYVNFKYRRTLLPFPEVFGYCGYFYGVEYFPSDKMLSSVSLTSYSNSILWKDRVKIALSLIDMISSLDGNFEKGRDKTHMCDVKADNFGVGDDLSVRVIDGDMIFSSAKMSSLLEEADCQQDSDCDFFDCEGICDIARGRCTKERRNLNIQVLCRDILSTGIHGTQLLKDPPKAYRAEIKEAIARCKSLTKEDFDKDDPGWNPTWTLKQLLLKSCDES